ncbi:MAG TPA: cyclophilin-like family protein, partial [Ardenticatenaceae bacterium]|nr:cyclophilin-like family protein [Ardenticatenaceae bacterium]
KWGVELPALVVERGDLVYWDVGSSLCIFAGPTPLDHEAAPQFRAPGPVSRVGRVDGDLDALATLPPGTRVQLEPIQEPG